MSDFDRGYKAGFRDGRANRAAGEEDEALTLDAIKAMSPDEINDRWGEIEPVLEEAARAR